MKNFIVAIVSVYLTIVAVLAGLIGGLQYFINWIKKLGYSEMIDKVLDKETRKDLFKVVSLSILSWPYWVIKGLFKGFKSLKKTLDDKEVQDKVREIIDETLKNPDKAKNEEKSEEESENDFDDEF